MIDTTMPKGNHLHSRSEYDGLTGYVERTYSTTWRDDKGVLWRKTCTVINLGRPDRGVPVDPDAQLAEEELQEDRRTSQWADAIANNRAERHGRARLLFREYFTKHGPQLMSELLTVTEWGSRRPLVEHFQMFPDMYQCFQSHPFVWGLCGQTWTPPKRELTGGVLRIRDTLLAQGPMSIREVSRSAGMNRNYIHGLLNEHKELFVKVGQVRVPNQMAHDLWGLVGVHDQEAA